MATATIVVSSPNWEMKAKDAIIAKKRVELVVKGLQAQTAGEALRRQPQMSNITGVEVALVAAVIIGVVAMVGLGVLAAVCLYGMNQGYTVTARHKVQGPMPFDDELYFYLVPPAS